MMDGIIRNAVHLLEQAIQTEDWEMVREALDILSIDEPDFQLSDDEDIY